MTDAWLGILVGMRSVDDAGPEEHESLLHVIADAAIEAEYETGHREETEAEARRHVVLRVLSIVAGFTLIGVGIAALPLPGPGWLIIIVGLQLLPFAWANRTIRLIRRRIPGVPEDGRIPRRTWAVMGAMVLTFSIASLMWGADVRTWVAEGWGEPDRVLG